MKTCPSCGRENAEDARFCSQCATPLETGLGAKEERKVVTCLFCDLVGFTARAERMDPEDVHRLLQPYHARVRAELERFGGTVEKFIGDAVMAVFGAPVAHEDDPERAVRAALAIRDQLVEDGELEIRIGITTGEALIALGASPAAGEGMASGDVVNTAARLQTAAPVNGVLVDETTYRATERAIEYEEAGPVEAKGKSAPVPVWTATRARARVGVERVGGAALVGREQEVRLLRETLARVVREREPQLETLVGVPGIGKSRLVYELFQTIESGEHGLIYWRHGRSLPYGEGVTFWGLGEMVKAQAGILESDSSEQAAQKLHEAVERFVPEPADGAWLERHLRPLAGLETDEPAGNRRDEAFAAWRRFLEAIADDRPLVLVFEDLHWADDALLDFVDYLLDWATGVALLVLSTARPELLTRREGWGGGKVNSSTILLSPLSEEETATLVRELLGRAAIDADLQIRLLEHAGGNPLYAEEFTRMHLERPEDAVLPESVQGMIAARLDTLPADEKELLQDAAVVGRVFWLGALGRERWTLEERLHSLGRKEFLTRQRRSSVAGEDEYAFRHALVRDVAYEQIPRVERVDKHRAAAEWIESLGRPDDHAEMLAHHYASALEYARAAGQDTEVLARRGLAALGNAGDRAFGLNAFAQAVSFYERAVELGSSDPRMLLRLGRALSIAADDRGLEVLQHAAESLLATGDRESAAEAHAFVTEAVQQQGQRDRAFDSMERAVDLVRDAPPSPAKARVLTESSRLLVLAGKPEDGIAVALEAFAMADELGLTELAARSLVNVGVAQAFSGEFSDAIEGLERSIDLCLSVSSPEAARAYHNLATCMWSVGELARVKEVLAEAVRVGERFGSIRMARASKCLLAWARYYTREWDVALRDAEAIIAECEAGTSMYFEYQARIVRARIAYARDEDRDAVLSDIRRAVELGDAVKDPQVLVQTLAHATLMFAQLELPDEAQEMAARLTELLTAADYRGPSLLGASEIVWVEDELGISGVFQAALLAANLDAWWRDLYEAVLEADFARAAEGFAALGYVEEGIARLRAGERFLADERIDEAEKQLRKALDLWRPLGATRYLREVEELLAEAGLEVPA